MHKKLIIKLTLKIMSCLDYVADINLLLNNVLILYYTPLKSAPLEVYIIYGRFNIMKDGSQSSKT